MAAINQPLSVLTSNRPQLHEVTRRSANFHPSVWGDHFLAYASHEKKAEAQEWQEHQQLKEKTENELYVVSLYFRLLRQHGYHVPSSVFEKFTEYDGKFKESLANNVEAILSLYEASHLRVNGEKILDEALIFATSHLKSMLPNLTDPLRSQVNEALKRPIYKRLTRIEARRYISIYEANETHDIVLLKFAKLDFNMLQKEHQQELGNLTRWDAVLLNELPEYMRVCYAALLDVYAEMEKELVVNGESYHINYAKNEMKKLVGAYYEEAKWFHNRRNPKFEEYMKVTLVTCGYMMLSTTSIVGMQGDFVTKEAFDWVSKEPLIVQAASIINRFMDDMVGHEFEQQRGYADTAVEICMKQYGKSKEETFNEFQTRVSNAWKDINQECLNPTAFPMPILIRVVNLARVMDLLYKDEDTYTHSATETKDIITSVLIDPII
nr:(-)-germacrene D synthase-like [Ipomoea batatas]